MKSIFFPLAAILFLGLAILSLGSLWARSAVESLAQNSSPTVDQPLTYNFREMRIRELRALERGVFVPEKVHAVLYRLLRESAEVETNSAARIKLYCETLSEIGLALKGEPRNGAYLINWANIRQLLGSGVRCDLPYTEGDYSNAARLAVESDPNNVSVLFAAAHLYEWADNNKESLNVLNRALALATELPSSQIDYVISRLKTPQDIAAVIPPRFPHVARWSIRLKSYKSLLYETARPVLADLQHRAIVESVRAYEYGKIPVEIHFKRLVSLYDAVATTAVRQELDAEVGRYYKAAGAEELSNYLDERRVLREMPILYASLSSDTRPLKTPLVRWNLERNFSLDESYASLGFYLPANEAPQLIELRSNGRAPQLTAAMLKVLVSNDNLNWVELQGRLQTEVLDMEGKTIVAIRPHAHYHKYWKINFASSSKAKTFMNSTERMLVVFGSDYGKEQVIR